MLHEVADFDPIEVERKERLRSKYEIEQEKFDEERYAYDNFDDE